MNAEERKRLRELEPPDCGDNSCAFARKRGGMRTNGGCGCHENGDQRARLYFMRLHNALPELLDEVDRLEARVKELSNPATWRATINRLESAELKALAELDERIAENAALKARVAELEGEITELTAPFSSGDPTKLTESEWARIHENFEKYAPKTPHVQVDKDGVWFIRLDLFASITEKLEARVEKLEAVRERAAALKARVAVLEEVRKAAARFIIAEGLSRTGPLGEQLALGSFDALKAALDRAGEK